MHTHLYLVLDSREYILTHMLQYGNTSIKKYILQNLQEDLKRITIPYNYMGNDGITLIGKYYPPNDLLDLLVYGVKEEYILYFMNKCGVTCKRPINEWIKEVYDMNMYNEICWVMEKKYLLYNNLLSQLDKNTIEKILISGIIKRRYK